RLALGAKQALEPGLAQLQEGGLDLLARGAQHGLELAKRNLLLLLRARYGVRLVRQLGLELLVFAQEREPLLVQLGRLAPVELAQLVAVLVVRQHRELGECGAQGQLLAFEGHPRREQRVLELVLLLGELCGDEAAFAGLAQPVQPFALLAVGTILFRPQGLQLVPAEQVGVARDDRRLLRHFLLPDAHGPALLRTLVEVALQLLLEFRRAADRGRRHREDSIPPSARNAARALRPSTSTARS